MLLALIVAGLYFFLGAWGAVLLWGVGALFSMCLAGMPFIFFFEGRDRYRQRRFLEAAGCMLGALVAAVVWLGAVGYTGYQAYLAIP